MINRLSFIKWKSNISSETALAFLLALTATMVYAGIHIQHFTPAHPEFDCDGYLILAKRMAQFQPLSRQDADAFRHQLHFWVEAKDGGMIAKFSPGYPLLMAVAYRIGGDEAMFWVSPLAGICTIFGAFLLFRMWMSEVMAGLAVWILAINPMWLSYPGYLLTHGVNTCAVTWGMYFLWRWTRRESGGAAILAGSLLGFAVTVRYTSLLMGIAVLIAVWVPCRKMYLERKINPPLIRSIILLILSYSALILGIMLYNWMHFGSLLTTGYGLSTEQSAFQLKVLWHNFGRVLNGINSTCLYLVFPLGLVGLLITGETKQRLMRIAWFLPLFVLYSSYYWQVEGMAFLRFFICTFPVLIGSAFMLLDAVKPSGSKMVHQLLTALFVLLVVYLQSGPSQEAMERIVSNGTSKERLAAGRMLAETFGEEIVVFSQSPYNAYLDTLRRFRCYDLVRFSEPWEGSERRHPVRTEAIRRFYQTTALDQRIVMKRDIVRKYLKAGWPIVFLIPKTALTKQQEELGGDFVFELVKEWREGDWGVYSVDFKN